MSIQAIAARIRALLSKTTENGATEAEAMLAALKARELMDKYHVEHGQLGLEAEGTIRYEFHTSHRLQYEMVRMLGTAIAKFTDCRAFSKRHEHKWNFFGLRSDVDFANWLCESLKAHVLMRSVEYELDCATRPDTNAFIEGACHRIAQRLFEAAKERAGTGTSQVLVVSKSAIVNRDFDALGLRLGSVPRPGLNGWDSGAYAAGTRAGDSASFGRPVAQARVQITHK